MAISIIMAKTIIEITIIKMAISIIMAKTIIKIAETIYYLITLSVIMQEIVYMQVYKKYIY
jgi:hypothetical protein